MTAADARDPGASPTSVLPPLAFPSSDIPMSEVPTTELATPAPATAVAPPFVPAQAAPAQPDSAGLGGGNPFALTGASDSAVGGNPFAVGDPTAPADVATVAVRAVAQQPRAVLGPVVPPRGSALQSAPATPARLKPELVPSPRSAEPLPTGGGLSASGLIKPAVLQDAPLISDPAGVVADSAPGPPAGAASEPWAGSSRGGAFAAVGGALVPGQPAAPASTTPASTIPSSATPAALPSGLVTSPAAAAPTGSRELPPTGAPAAPSRRRRLLLLGAGTAAAAALGAALVVSGLPGEPPVLAPTTVPADLGAAAGTVVDGTAVDGTAVDGTTPDGTATGAAASDVTGTAEPDIAAGDVAAGDAAAADAATTSTDPAALGDEVAVRDPFAETTTSAAGSTGVEPVATDAVLPGAAGAAPAPDAAAAAPAVVAGGLQVTWTEVRDGGWHVFTIVDGTEGTTVAATAGSALGTGAPASDVVFAGPSTVVDGSGAVVDSVSVRTSTTTLQLVLGQTVTVG